MRLCESFTMLGRPRSRKRELARLRTTLGASTATATMMMTTQVLVKVGLILRVDRSRNTSEDLKMTMKEEPLSVAVENDTFHTPRFTLISRLSTKGRLPKVQILHNSRQAEAVVDPEKSWFKLMKRNWPKRTLISTSTNR
jgi:hypothetical protein